MDMKKSFYGIMLFFALVLIIVSCNGEPADGAGDKLVAVSFDDTAKALVASLPTFDKNTIYWKYAARKSLNTEDSSMLDGSGLRSGETPSYNEAGAQPISDGNAGLGSGDPYTPYKIPGFSQGVWDFMLFGYSTVTNTGTPENPVNVYSNLVYCGEAKEQSLKKDSNAVNITVSPVSDHGNGILFVDTANITFVPIQSETTGVATFTQRVFVDDDLQNTTSIAIAPGAHTVKVQFVNTVNSIDYILAEGMVTATVYSNLTTTVTGSLNELATYVQFDANSAYPGMPTGTLSKSQDSGTGKWTITFTNTNPASVPTSYAWYVNGVVQSGEIGTSFVYTPGFESANITCVFGNTSGTGSASVYIN